MIQRDMKCMLNKKKNCIRIPKNMNEDFILRFLNGSPFSQKKTLDA